MRASPGQWGQATPGFKVRLCALFCACGSFLKNHIMRSMYFTRSSIDLRILITLLNLSISLKHSLHSLLMLLSFRWKMSTQTPCSSRCCHGPHACASSCQNKDKSASSMAHFHFFNENHLHKEMLTHAKVDNWIAQ